MFVDWDGLWPKIYRHRHSLYLSVLDSKIPDLDAVSTYQFQIRSAPHFHTDLDGLVDQLQRYRKQYYRILILVSTEERGAKLVEFLKEHDIPAQYTDEVGDKLKAGNCIVTKGALENGMEYAGFKLLILTELEIYGKKRAKRRSTVPAQVRLTESDLNLGLRGPRQPRYRTVHGIETWKCRKPTRILLIRFAGKAGFMCRRIKLGFCNDTLAWMMNRRSFRGRAAASGQGRAAPLAQDLAEGLTTRREQSRLRFPQRIHRGRLV